MTIKFDTESTIPAVTPFPFVKHNKSILKYISASGGKKVPLIHNKLTCGLTYKWMGWTDGGLWLVDKKPSSRRFRLQYKKIIITNEIFQDYSRRYKYVGSMPALFHRGVYLNVEGRQDNPVAMSLFADTYRSIFILQLHLKVLYTTLPGVLTFWIHPYLNSYTVTENNRIVAFGVGVPHDCMLISSTRLNSLQRKSILAVRRWWEYRIQKVYMERNNPDFMFARKLTPPKNL